MPRDDDLTQAPPGSSSKPQPKKRRSRKRRPGKPRSKKVGRPATGIQELTRLSTFFTQEGRALLDAVSWARHEPIYRLLERLIREHVDGLAPDERQRVEEAAAVLLRRRQHGGEDEDGSG